MEMKIVTVFASIALLATQVFAGNGDLIVNGYLGVGTSLPLSTGKVFIKDNSSYSSEWNSAGIVISNNTVGAPTLRVGTDVTKGISYLQSMHINQDWGASLVLQANGGNTGIGTITPGIKLSVGGATSGESIGFEPYSYFNSAFSTANPSIGHMVKTNINSAGYQKSTGIMTSSSLLEVGDNISFATKSVDSDAAGTVWDLNNNTKMIIMNNGNVGIGTQVPTRKLDLFGDTSGLSFEAGTGSPNSGAIRFGDGTGWKFNIGRSRNSSGGALNSGAAGVVMTIQDNGYVGIGTPAPNYPLHVVGPGFSTYGWLYGSDIRLKRNLLPVTDALNKVLQLSGFSYEWKKDIYNIENSPEVNETDAPELKNKAIAEKNKKIPDGRHYGVIAQEIEKVLPELVSEDAGGTKAVDYSGIIPVLIEAIKEQQKQIEKQQNQIEKLMQVSK